MSRASRFLVTFLASIVFSIAAEAQSPRFKVIPGPRAGGGEVKWTVDKGGTTEAQQDYVILEGGVVIEYQDIKLQATKVTWNKKTQDVTAQGNVIIDQGPTRITADHAIYNLENKTGTFFQATGTLDPAMYFSGDRIEKVDEDTYRLVNGVFTSCDLDNPAWSFRIGNAEITLDDYAHMRNVSFRARRLPIFWTPRLVWPTKRDRTRGFLIPRVNLASKFGQRLELAYFVPFGDSIDATVNADLSTNGYFSAGTQVRYVPSENVKIGDLTVSTVRDVHMAGSITESPDPSNPLDATMQWRYHYRHAQENLPGGFRGVVDVEDFSNLDFYREWDRDPRLHTLSNVYSSAYLTKNRPTYSLNILSDRREILLPGREQRFEQLPSLQYRMYPQRLGPTPLYFSLESSASYLKTNAIDFNSNAEASYFRGDFFPTLALQLKTPAWFSIRPQISARQTYYSDSLAERVNPTDPRTPSGESVSRFYAQGQVELVGPSFSRIFNRGAGGFSRFKHVIEPRFRYLYTGNVNDQEKVIRFDTVDNPFLPIVRDSVEYSLTQRIIGKQGGPNGSAREVLSFTLRQTASLSKPLPTASGALPGSEPQKFTPVFATLRFNPYQSVTLDASATVGNVTRQLQQSSLSANLIGTGSMATRYLSLTWFATYRDPRTNAGESSQFRINTGSPLIGERLRTDIQLNYDAHQGKFLEQRYAFGTTGSCYGLGLAYRRILVYDARTGREKSDGYVDISVSLKNVGTFGNVN